MKKSLLMGVCAMVLSGMCVAESIKLPAAEKVGGMPLMEAIAARKSSRDFVAGATLSMQELSNALWCANGISRGNMRTAPSAVNAQAVDIYVFTEKGIYLYQPKENALKEVKKGDYRAATGLQAFVANAAANFVYVYDKSKWPHPEGNDGKFAAADASFCAENVYLYCASAGLKTVVRGSFKEVELGKLLGLPGTKRVVLAQSIGK